MEVVASELFSARVAVSPRPSESDPSKVPTDPSRGRYKAVRDFGAPYGERLCKLVRTIWDGKCENHGTWFNYKILPRLRGFESRNLREKHLA